MDSLKLFCMMEAVAVIDEFMHIGAFLTIFLNSWHESKLQQTLPQNWGIFQRCKSKYWLGSPLQHISWKYFSLYRTRNHRLCDCLSSIVIHGLISIKIKSEVKISISLSMLQAETTRFPLSDIQSVLVVLAVHFIERCAIASRLKTVTTHRKLYLL